MHPQLNVDCIVIASFALWIAKCLFCKNFTYINVKQKYAFQVRVEIENSYIIILNMLSNYNSYLKVTFHTGLPLL